MKCTHPLFSRGFNAFLLYEAAALTAELRRRGFRPSFRSRLHVEQEDCRWPQDPYVGVPILNSTTPWNATYADTLPDGLSLELTTLRRFATISGRGKTNNIYPFSLFCPVDLLCSMAA
jgi:hypothetical protein